MKDKNLLIVGGAGRNAGKTEFCCRLIQKLATHHDIYALKVSAVLPDELMYHGDHSSLPADIKLFKEENSKSTKDTSRMLRAGAKAVYFLHGDNETIVKGYHQFKQQIPPGSLIISESNSLAAHIEPGLLVVVKAAGEDIKSRAAALLASADIVVHSDGQTGFSELDRIEIDIYNNWHLL